ncbi:hypothetical protein FRC00_014049, partial [Tulasnella sp. 408]
MFTKKAIFTPALLLAACAQLAQADVPLYGQCGGYSQCQAGSGTTTTTKTTTTSSKTTTTTKTSSTSTTKSSTTSTKTSTTTTKTTTTGGTNPTSANGLEGYATMNGGTPGGAGGPTITVSSLTALRDAVLGTSPKIIRISTIIQGDGEAVDVGSNTSILGSCGGGLTGGGFRVKKSSNVIFRNLKLYKSKAPTDLIEIQASTNVWVDHNEFYSDMTSGKDYYDGACDVNHGSDWITISWNYFHDHYKTSLVGHSDKNESEDKGHFHVTYHHNFFHHLGSRIPSLRFGTGHVYNNYYDDIQIGGIDSRLGAQMLIENNVFVNAI